MHTETTHARDIHELAEPGRNTPCPFSDLTLAIMLQASMWSIKIGYQWAFEIVRGGTCARGPLAHTITFDPPPPGAGR